MSASFVLQGGSPPRSPSPTRRASASPRGATAPARAQRTPSPTRKASPTRRASPRAASPTRRASPGAGGGSGNYVISPKTGRPIKVKDVNGEYGKALMQLMKDGVVDEAWLVRRPL